MQEIHLLVLVQVLTTLEQLEQQLEVLDLI